MERQIKFRAWDYGKKIFLPTKTYAVLSDKEFGAIGIMIIDFENYQQGEYLYPHSQVLNQFTGLKDKNGVDIYEGDILKPTIKSNKILGKIVWLENRSSFGIHWFLQLGTGDIEYCVNDLQMEIIGNIYENPNLLQDGK